MILVLAAYLGHFLIGFFERIRGIVYILIGAVFSFLSPEFLTEASAGSILASAVQFGVVGLGVTVLMIAGEFDLSVASVYSLCPLVMASLWINHGVNVVAALGIAMPAAAMAQSVSTA